MKQIIHKGVVTDKFITEEGKVYDSSGNEVKYADNGAGYLTVHLYSYDSGTYKRSKREYVHRLVAMMFLDNPHSYSQVNHKDCNKSNNHIDNLEWISNSENINHAHKSGRMNKRYEVGAVTYLTNDEVIDCYTRIVKYKERISDVARSLNRPRTTISSIVNKRSRQDITDKLDEDFKRST